jgi:hypothetical protein
LQSATTGWCTPRRIFTWGLAAVGFMAGCASPSDPVYGRGNDDAPQTVFEATIEVHGSTFIVRSDETQRDVAIAHVELTSSSGASIRVHDALTRDRTLHCTSCHCYPDGCYCTGCHEP